MSSQHGEISTMMQYEVYPQRLLPKSNYRSCMSRTDLKDVNPLLQRKCNMPFEKCCVDNDPDNVTRAAFGEVGLAGMSVNVLGGLFLSGDERWQQNVSKDEEWTSGDVDLKMYEGKYELRDVEASVYFNFASADEMTWTFPRVFPDKAQHDKYKAAIIEGMSGVSVFSKKTPYVLNAHAECHHKPTVLNYWHVEVKSYIDSIPPEEITNSGSSYRKKALNQMVETLRVKSTLNPPESVPEISMSIYTA